MKMGVVTLSTTSSTHKITSLFMKKIGGIIHGNNSN